MLRKAYRAAYGAWPDNVGAHVHLYALGANGETILGAISADDLARTKAALDAMLTAGEVATVSAAMAALTG